MIPAVRLVPPGHTLVTLGERFFGGLARYYDRAPRGAPYFPRKMIWTFPHFYQKNQRIYRANVSRINGACLPFIPILSCANNRLLSSPTIPKCFGVAQ